MFDEPLIDMRCVVMSLYGQMMCCDESLVEVCDISLHFSLTLLRLSICFFLSIPYLPAILMILIMLSTSSWTHRKHCCFAMGRGSRMVH